MTTKCFPLTIGKYKVPNEDHLLTHIESGMKMRADAVHYLIVHCSATRETQDYTAEQLRADHLSRGFIDVGYHYYIRRDGTVTQHRRLDEVGAHCRPFNRCSIGICYRGGLDHSGNPKDTRTMQQRSALVALLRDLKVRFPKSFIRGHCEMPGATPKDCPCFKPSKEYAYLDKSPLIGKKE